LVECRDWQYLGFLFQLRLWEETGLNGVEYWSMNTRELGDYLLWGILLMLPPHRVSARKPIRQPTYPEPMFKK